MGPDLFCFSIIVSIRRGKIRGLCRISSNRQWGVRDHIRELGSWALPKWSSAKRREMACSLQLSKNNNCLQSRYVLSPFWEENISPTGTNTFQNNIPLTPLRHFLRWTMYCVFLSKTVLCSPTFAQVIKTPSQITVTTTSNSGSWNKAPLSLTKPCNVEDVFICTCRT